MTVPARITASPEYAEVGLAFARLGAALDTELLRELEDFAPRALFYVRLAVPVRKTPRQQFFRGSARRPSGGLRSLLTSKVDKEDLRLSVGLLTREARQDGFYGYILDAGRGLSRSRSDARTRRKPLKDHVYANGLGGSYDSYTVRFSRRISPIAPTTYDITFGRTREWLRAEAGPILSRTYDRVLAASAWGNT